MSDRRATARNVRQEAAERAHLRHHPDHPTNGEESDYRNANNELNYIANFYKGLQHNTTTGEVVPEDYRRLLKALATGRPEDFEEIKLGDVRKLTNPQAALAFDLEGPDVHSLAQPPAPRIDGPENSGEMGELYWMALLRDVPFKDFGSDTGVGDAANSLSDEFSDFRGPKDPGTGRVTPATVFRGFTPGDLVGPYVSQFMLRGNKELALDLTEKDGYIQYGTLRIDQRQLTAKPGIDYITDYGEWLAVQNGEERSTLRHDDATRAKEAFDETPRFIRNMRDLATYVHFDALYEAYLNACLLLLARDVPLDSGNPYRDSANQIGFGVFGGPHILSLVTEVATRALKAVWFQKWFVHRRLRPEAFGGLIHAQKTPGLPEYPVINEEILDSSVLQKIFDRNEQLNKDLGRDTTGTYLLPQAFPEGSPTHPAYGAGHATVAGACVTILKAWFDESYVISDPVQASADGTTLETYPGGDAENITVGGELNKVAANVAIGRNMAGVHWRTDYTESVKLGESIAIGILEEQKNTYNEDYALSLTKFDGTAIQV
jgi:hypothetical protein